MDDAPHPTGSARYHGPVERAFRRVRPLVLRAVVGSIVAAALVGVVSALVGDFGATSWRLLGTIALFVFFALCCWYDADVSARRSAAFGVTSIAVSIVLLLAGVAWLWVDDGDDLLHWLWIAFVARVALLHVHLLLTNKRRFTTDAMQAVTVATIVLVGALAVLLVLPFLVERRYGYPELYWRVVVAIAILDLLGTVLIPLTYALFHAGRGEDRVVHGAPDPRPAPGAQPASWGPVAPSGQVAPEGSTHRMGAALGPAAPGAGGTPAGGTPPGGAGPAAGTPTVGDVAGGHGSAAAPAAPAAAGAGAGEAPVLPPVGAYPVLRAPFLLEWPRYANGQPVPARPDGSPDLTGVRGWVR